jgi:hypothetical protein
MEAVAAEALSALGADPLAAEPEADGGAEQEPAGAAWPSKLERAGSEVGALPAGVDPAPGPAKGCASHASARSLLSGLGEADAFELDARLRRAVALEQRIEAEAAPLLRALADRGAHRLRGFATFGAFARERLGLSPRKTRALVRLARAGERCGALRHAFANGRLSWVQAHALVPILLATRTEEHSVWIERASRVSVRRLEQEVDAALLHLAGQAAQAGRTGQTGAQATPPGATPAAPQAEPETEPESERFFFTGPADVVRLFRAVLCSVRRRLEHATGRPASEGDAADWMFDHAFLAWGANDARVPREHAVFARDGWRCTVPGCTSYRNLHDHHVRYRSAGGSDDESNLTTLCAKHHLRGVHATRLRWVGRAPDGLTWQMGLRPGAAPLVAYRSGDLRL